MSAQRLKALAVVAFLVGTVVILLAEATWLRMASAVILVAYVVLGLFAIATPEFLEQDRD
jgi:hypothetical protein